jgi:hypothetical protein
VYAGATIAMRRRFSASAFLDDVRRYRATYFNYVGKPLSYILATPPRPDDRAHTLVRVLGNGGSERDIARFRERFGVPVTDIRLDRRRRVMVGDPPMAPAPRRVPEGSRQRPGRAAHPPSSTMRAGCDPEAYIGEIVNTGRAFRATTDDDAVPDEERLVLVGDLSGCRRMAVVAGARLRLARKRRNPAAPWNGRRLSSVVLSAVRRPAPDVGDDVVAALQLEPAVALNDVFDEFLAPTRPRREMESRCIASLPNSSCTADREAPAARRTLGCDPSVAAGRGALRRMTRELGSSLDVEAAPAASAQHR